jgi:uncharacterized protein DUF6438
MPPARALRASVLILAAAAACYRDAPRHAPLEGHSSAPTPGRHEHLASIERTACYGWCPVYKLTVFRDGAVEYEGTGFVKRQGKATGHLRPDQLAALDELFQKHGYLGLADSYEAYEVTDAPSVYTAYSTVGGKRKDVKHYLGDTKAPAVLGKIEEGIDRIVHVEQWIGTEEERQKLSGR